MSIKPLKLTAERVGATVRRADQGSPGRLAHGKLDAGRSLAAIRYCDTRSFHEVVRLILRLNRPCHWVSLGT